MGRRHAARQLDPQVHRRVLGAFEEVVEGRGADHVRHLVRIADRGGDAAGQDAAVEFERGDEGRFDVEMRVDEARHRDAAPSFDRARPAIRAVGADDRVAADGDVGRRQGARDEIVEAHVRDDEIGLAAPRPCAMRGAIVAASSFFVMSASEIPARSGPARRGRDPTCGRAYGGRCGARRAQTRVAAIPVPESCGTRGVVHIMSPRRGRVSPRPEEGMNASHSAVFEALKASGPTRADSLARITLLTRLLDSAFLIPGLNRRVGLDAIIGLVPGIGDAFRPARELHHLGGAPARPAALEDRAHDRQRGGRHRRRRDPVSQATCSTCSSRRTSVTCASSTSIW